MAKIRYFRLLNPNLSGNVTLKTIDTGFFKLDGGAMFGVVPKSMWQSINPADARNLCTWAMRCLLVETDGKLLLVDTGAGNKQDAKFFGYYDIDPANNYLTDAIQAAGYLETDITDVLLTHLHFDHVGGAVSRTGDHLIPTFANAAYWSHSQHWDWAADPNPRERASFRTENIGPLQESGQLRFADREPFPFPAITLPTVDGHTEKMMLPTFSINGRIVVFVADLIPSAGHIPVPYVMGYDMRPLVTMDEKERLLTRAAAENWILVFEHDPVTEAATVMLTDKGVRLREKGRLADFL